MRWIALLALLLPALAPAATNEVSAPSLGFVFDANSRSVRPILGVFGSARIGDGLTLDEPLAVAEISPDGKIALGVTMAAELISLDLTQPLPGAKAIEGGLAQVDRIFYSPSGSAAIVYDRDSKRAQILTGLPDAPTVDRTIGLGGLNGVLTALAVNDAGDLALAAASPRQGPGAITAFPSSGSDHPVADIGLVRSIAFLPNSQDAFAADVERRQVVSIGNGAGIDVAASAQLERPVAVASHGQSLVMAGETGKLVVVNLADNSQRTLDCDCKPLEIKALPGEGLFQLGADVAQPMRLLDAAKGETRFIPALAPEAAPEQAIRPSRAGRSR